MIKRNLICGIIIFIMLLLPSITAYSITKDDGFLFKTNTNEIKVIKSQENYVDTIFDDMKEKIGKAKTQDDYKIVFKEILFELEKYDLLHDISANEIYEMICSSYDEGNTYSIYGESGNTYFLGRTGVFFYELHEKYPFFAFPFSLIYDLLRFIDFEYRQTIAHTNSYIIFGYLISLRLYVYGFHPADGYIKINSSDGQTEYNCSFYGHSKFMIEQHNPSDPEVHIIYCIGVKGFKGLLINGYYFGTAKEINIGYNAPDPFI